MSTINLIPIKKEKEKTHRLILKRKIVFILKKEKVEKDIFPLFD